ncbi:MAG: Hsp20/alpha crystallin family protein [Chloroflexi bacterium]|nr:Hsp20/alpha crystallin family protein [Chloroflexota bacterium]
MATLIRWNPFREMLAFERMLDDMWRGAAVNNALPLDLYESDSAYVLHADVPGLQPDQINIRFEDGLLTISVQSERPAREDARALLQERAFGHYNRTLRLPVEVETDKAEARYENGVLTLTLPKAAAAQPRQIAVKFNSTLLNAQN